MNWNSNEDDHDIHWILSSDGECRISRYAGIGRQLLPKNPLKEIFKKGLFLKNFDTPADWPTERQTLL